VAKRLRGSVWDGEWGRSRDGCISWGGNRRRGRGSLGMILGRPIVTNGTLLHSCARVTRSSQNTLGRTCLKMFIAHILLNTVFCTVLYVSGRYWPSAVILNKVTAAEIQKSKSLPAYRPNGSV